MGVVYVSPYRQVLADRQQRFYASIAVGNYKPFVEPWDSSPAFMLLTAIVLIPRLPRQWQRPASYAAFAVILSETIRIVAYSRMLTFAGGYGIGLSSTWGAIMSFALLICNDVGSDFERIETRPVDAPISKLNGQENGSVTQPRSTKPCNIDLRQRKVPNVYTARNIHQPTFPGSEQAGTKPYRLIWQGYPHGSTAGHCLDWACDLATSFRGVGWSHRVPTAGSIDIPLPEHASKDKKTSSGDSNQPTAVPRQTLRALQLQSLKDFALGYLLLDFLKTSMVTDPYFLGLAPLQSPSPWSWLARLNNILPIATRFVRLSTALAGVIVALTFIFSLNPLFFATVLPWVTDISRITRAPLSEPWLYPPQWYPLATSVLEQGLGGLWGRFWHQMFRYGISEPSRVLIKQLQLERRGTSARIVQLAIAFGLSGIIHAGSSYTTFSVSGSRPLSGPLLFFLVQGMGVFAQSGAVKLLHGWVPGLKSLPRALRQMTNLLFVLTFLYLTGPLLADDFARCGVWLFEPVPISLLRGLGFGPGGKDEGWFTWYQDGARWISWWDDAQWWKRGLAIW